MVIKNIVVDEGNLIAVIKDPSVYAIKKDALTKDYAMRPIQEIRIEDIWNPEVAFVRLAE